jgi:hypothetical protein
MAKKSLLAMALVLLMILVTISVWAAVPDRINYQGKLTDPDGNPMSGAQLIRVFIYEQAVGGTELWFEEHSATLTEDGVYNLQLGSQASFPSNLFVAYPALYLEVRIWHSGTGWEILEPRQELLCAAFSMTAASAEDADTLDGMDSLDFADTVHDHSFGEITGEATDSQIPDSITINNAATADYAASADSADYADSAGDADTVDGLHASDFGDITGVTAGTGLTGGGSSGGVTVNVGAGTGIDVSSSAVSVEVPLSLSGSNVEPIIKGVNIDAGIAVYGKGVYGVFGWGSSYGVRGYSDSISGKGVWGYTSGGTAGVVGESISGYGVSGSSTNSYGVNGYSGSSIAVYGNTSSGWAGYFNGPVRVTGLLTKSGGGFQIDHPLEPENKYLNHSFVESPDMKNVYDGVVVLDEKGEAWVQFPEWFGALNKDFRYQLTCIGGFAQVYIAQEISDNRFKIAGGVPGRKVSWQVTGIRQDPWAEANRKPVEEDKPAEELGFYLSPESYGQPEEKGIEWARNPEMMQRMKKEREKRMEADS